MIIDSLGLPKENGASDLQDSVRLASVMTTFSYPISVPLEKYVIIDGLYIKYCRHPLERKYDFSRDQALCLMAGFYFSGKKNLVDRSFVDGKDWFFPDHRGHEKRCKGLKANWFEDLWLKATLLFHAKVTPLEELNQTLCMCAVAGRDYVRLYTKLNPRWREAITLYWCGWRGEPELADCMIRWVEQNGGV